MKTLTGLFCLHLLIPQVVAQDWSWLDHDQPIPLPAFIGSPIAVDVDEKGHLYIVDADDMTIHKMAPDGQVLHSFGRKGQGPGEFQYLKDIAVDAANQRVWAIDYYSTRLFCYNLEGTLIYQKNESWDTTTLTIRPDSKLLFGGTAATHNMAVYNHDGDFEAWFGHTNKDVMYHLPDQLRRAAYTVVGPDGSVYIAYSRAPIVAAYGPDLKERWERERPWLGDEPPTPSKLRGMKLTSDIYHIGLFVLDDVVYVATEEDEESAVVAFRAKDGKPLGHRKIDFRPRAVIQVNGAVYAFDSRNELFHQFTADPARRIKKIAKAPDYSQRYQTGKNTKILTAANKPMLGGCGMNGKSGCTCASGKGDACGAGCCGKLR